MGEEVVDEVNFCDDVGASVVEGAELAFMGTRVRIPHPPPKQESIHASECFFVLLKLYWGIRTQ